MNKQRSHKGLHCCSQKLTHERATYMQLVPKRGREVREWQGRREDGTRGQAQARGVWGGKCRAWQWGGEEGTAGEIL